jgi:hypothetical protein
MIIGSLLADIVNRRTILLVAAVVFLIFAIPYFYLINTGSFILATIAEIIGFEACGPYPSRRQMLASHGCFSRGSPAGR